MAAIDFEYDDLSLSDFGMIIGSFNGAKDETVSSGADLVFSQVKAAHSNKFNLYSSTYDAPLEVTFQVLKNPCTANNNMVLTPQETSAIKRWLCRKEYHKFTIDDAKYSSIYWKGTFSVKDVLVGDNVVGLELTFHADANFGYYECDDIEEEFEYDSDDEDATNVIEIDNESDEIGFSYPKIVVTLGGQTANSYDLEISDSTGKTSIIKNCVGTEVITLDSENQIITSSKRVGKVLAKDFNFIFPRLVNTYDETENTITINNVPCSVTLSYEPICKTGF